MLHGQSCSTNYILRRIRWTNKPNNHTHPKVVSISSFLAIVGIFFSCHSSAEYSIRCMKEQKSEMKWLSMVINNWIPLPLFPFIRKTNIFICPTRNAIGSKASSMRVMSLRSRRWRAFNFPDIYRRLTVNSCSYWIRTLWTIIFFFFLISDAVIVWLWVRPRRIVNIVA